MARKIMSVFGSNGQEAQATGPTAAATDAEAAGLAAAPSAAGRLSVIVLGKTLSFKGELSAEEDMILFGRVEGSIRHSAALTVGMGGTVVGNIRARVVTIKGTVEGDVEASESITITPTGNVVGDVIAPRVCIVEGAQFNGAVEMPEAPLQQTDIVQTPTSPGAHLAETEVEKLLDKS
jgi:cytoskeletal protein CcmA (bactofilin family)